MSVVIAIKVSEGLVLAADSASTLAGQAKGPDGVVQTGVLKIFFNAKKLLQVGDFPIGVLTWGISGIGMRTVESHIREWEHKNHWQSLDRLKRAIGGKEYSVKNCAASLREHIEKVCLDQYEVREKIPALGILVTGYSEGKFFPEMWGFEFPSGTEVVDQRPDIEGRPDFGASWFGAADALVRLHWGRDDRAIDILAKKFNVPGEEIKKDLLPLQYAIPFAQMPLQDAVDYAQYMIGTAIGRYRFVLGSELCGGAIDIAAITQTKFEWISKKSLTRGAS